MKRRKLAVICGGAALVCAAPFGMAASAGPARAAGPPRSVTPLTECATGTSAPDVTRDASLGRAQVWVDANVPYSQSACYANGTLGSYREDCSGFVSMAWDLSYSPTTYELNPDDPQFTGITHKISWSELQPGDALVRDSGGVDHMALFVRWTDSTHYILDDETHVPTGTIQETPTVLNDGYWSTFQPIRYNNIQEGPSNWATYANGRLRIAQTGSGGNVYEKGKDYPGSSDWASWTSLGKGGEPLSGTPAFVHHGDQYDLFAVGSSGQIYHRIDSGGTWGSWYALTTVSGDPVKASQGTGVSAVYGRDHMRLFYVGPDNEVHQTYYDEGDGWHSQSLGGDYRGTPSVIVSGDRTDVYVTGAEGYIYHKSRTGDNDWTGWTEVTTVSGDNPAALPGTGLAAVHGNGDDRLFYVGGDDAVHQTYYVSGDGWHSQSLDGDYRGVPAVTVTGNRIDVFAYGTAGNVFHKSRLIGGDWTDWNQIADAP